MPEVGFPDLLFLVARLRTQECLDRALWIPIRGLLDYLLHSDGDHGLHACGIPIHCTPHLAELIIRHHCGEKKYAAKGGPEANRNLRLLLYLRNLMQCKLGSRHRWGLRYLASTGPAGKERFSDLQSDRKPTPNHYRCFVSGFMQCSEWHVAGRPRAFDMCYIIIASAKVFSSCVGGKVCTTTTADLTTLDHQKGE